MENPFRRSGSSHKTRESMQDSNSSTKLVSMIGVMLSGKQPSDVTDLDAQFFDNLLNTINESSEEIPYELFTPILLYFKALRCDRARFVVGRLIKFTIEHAQDRSLLPESLIFDMVWECLQSEHFPFLTSTFLQIVHLSITNKDEDISNAWKDRFSLQFLLQLSNLFTKDKYPGTSRGDVFADWLLCIYDHLQFSHSTKDIEMLSLALSQLMCIVQLWDNSCCNFLAVLDALSQSKFMDTSLFNRYTFPAWILAMVLSYERPDVMSAALQVLGSLLENRKYEVTMSKTGFDVMALLEIITRFSNNSVICQQALNVLGLFVRCDNNIVRYMLEHHWEDAIMDWFADSSYEQKERTAFFLNEFVKAAIGLDLGQAAITPRLIATITELLDCAGCEMTVMESIAHVLLYIDKKEGELHDNILSSLFNGTTVMESLASLTDHENEEIASTAREILNILSPKDK